MVPLKPLTSILFQVPPSILNQTSVQCVLENNGDVATSEPGSSDLCAVLVSGNNLRVRAINSSLHLDWWPVTQELPKVSACSFPDGNYVLSITDITNTRNPQPVEVGNKSINNTELSYTSPSRRTAPATTTSSGWPWCFALA